MAKTPAAQAEPQFTEAEIGRAIADTEQEIWDEALGQPSDENDGDRSLEEMDEDIPGAQDEAEEPEVAEELAASEEDEDAEGEEPLEEEPPQRGIPPQRLREEADRRRAAEAERARDQAEIRELRARLDGLERTQPKKADDAPRKPDMFADPDGYEKWVLDQAEARAAAKFETQQRERDERRVNDAFADAARGPRSFEFNAAYGALTQLDPRNPNAQATVRSIVNSHDPAKALFDWWDQNGAADFRDSVLTQLVPNYRPQGQRQPQRGATQPQREFRLPKSLNGATGGAHRATDPDLYNDRESESSVFDYAMR